MEATATTEALSTPAREFLDRGPGRHFIGGEWLESADGRTFETIDPATGRPITEVAQGGPEDVDRAAKAARVALEGDWGKLTPSKKTGLIWALGEQIKANLPELAELESLDNGKPVAYAQGDMAAAVGHLRYYAGWPTKIEGETLPVSRPDFHVYTRREPVGVCGQIIPWNYPLLMAIWKIAPVLAAGCTTVLKPAEQTPLTALRLGELIAEAGIPAGTVNIVTGDGETGAAIVDHPGIDKIAFTGSTAVGREIGAKCGGQIKRLTLELGGKSPNIILPDADLDQAIKGSYEALYENSGQVCSAGSRLFVHSSLHDQVLEGLTDIAKTAKVGPGLAEETELGPVVSAEQHERVLGYIDSGKGDGAELLAGGGVPDDANGGYFVEPTLFSGVTDDMKIAREEIFGPVGAVLPFKDIDDAIAIANDSIYGLAASIWTKDLNTAIRAGRDLEAGVVWVNCFDHGDMTMPWGGYKQSGFGRDKCMETMTHYTQTKSVWIHLG
jgi:acyl-CoA reductase-like NAD-dependent aldehyde dehydrogenase